MMSAPAKATTSASPEATAMPGEDSACRLRRNQPQAGVSARTAAIDGARDGRARRQPRQHLQTPRQLVWPG